MKEKILNHLKGNYKSFFEKHLSKVQKVGGAEYRAICPFHKDTKLFSTITVSGIRCSA
jgi:hypothetical protein